MKLVTWICRIVIGFVFIFSGLAKAIDPLGTAYKFHDYFQAFNLGFLSWFSLPLAIILFTSEFISGFSVLTGFRFRTGLWGIIILMVIFTPVTFILAIFNPVSDCGCFGDAIHLTNWQTFWKNIVLTGLTAVLYINRKTIAQHIGKTTEWIVISLAILICIGFSLFNLRYLPVIDFLPYKTGVKIADKMTIPEGVAPDKYRTTFLYRKNGMTKEFTLDNYPASDSTWKFVDQKSVLIKKGYEPPIHDFIISTMAGEDITQKILSSQGSTLLMISKKLSGAGDKHLSAGFELGRYCLGKSIDFYVLTSSGTEEAGNYRNGLTFCSADETTLKTMVRANPGYMLICNGTIIGKWSWANVPAKEWFENRVLR